MEQMLILSLLLFLVYTLTETKSYTSLSSSVDISSNIKQIVWNSFMFLVIEEIQVYLKDLKFFRDGKSILYTVVLLDNPVVIKSF